jgi:hypothetical protein
VTGALDSKDCGPRKSRSISENEQRAANDMWPASNNARQRAFKKSIRAVLYDKMNSCYAVWYLEPISLNTHRCVSNPHWHSIRSSLNKLKSAEVRRVAGVSYTNTWSPRRQAAATAALNSGLLAKPRCWCRRCMRTQPQRR